jgi:hypothetical protein
MATIAHVEKVDFLEQLFFVVFKLADHLVTGGEHVVTEKGGSV